MISNDLSRVEVVKNLYAILCIDDYDRYPLDLRAQIVGELEKLTCSDFKNTQELHHKIGMFLVRQDTPAKQLKEMRIKKGWSQDTLGAYLGISQPFVVQMEKGRKPLTGRALAFISKNES